MGRPVYHLSGLSPAYALSWAYSLLTDDPYRFITILSLSFCFLAGCFTLGFCREAGLKPAAGLVAAISLAASPLFIYWLTFPMFAATWCWSAGMLWALARQVSKPGIPSWSLLAFSTYSLFMTGYPQSAVFQLYILGGYGVYRTYKLLSESTTPMPALGFMLSCGSALLAGALQSAPVYLDLAQTSAESSRMSANVDFFLATLPRFQSADEVLRYLVFSLSPELFGNPMGEHFPYAYSGLSLPLLVTFCCTVTLAGGRLRQTWGWWLAIAIFGCFTYIPAAFSFAFKYLGFNLSRSSPLGGLVLPLTILTAYGVDAMLRRTRASRCRMSVVFAGILSFALLITCIALGKHWGIAVQWHTVALMALTLAILGTFMRHTHPFPLLLCLCITLSISAWPLMLRQQVEAMASSSVLVEKIRKILPDESRFAIVSPDIHLFPPNINTTVGLNSIHSYNSLSSTRYRLLIEQLGGEVQTYGRWNGSIAPDFSHQTFWMSHIGLLLSRTELNHPSLTYVDTEAQVLLYRVNDTMGSAWQVENREPAVHRSFTAVHEDEEKHATTLQDARKLPGQSARLTRDDGDIKTYALSSSRASTLVLDHKYHQNWHAWVKTGKEWHPAATTEVNGVFQGVLISDGATSVEMRFLPWSRFAWLGHVFWALLCIWTGCMVLLSSTRRRSNKGLAS